MSKTLGLALGCGGARGVAHIGFLQALEEAGIKPNYIAGCSMGSIVGGCYASGMTVKEMHDIIVNLKLRNLADLSVSPITQLSLFKSKKMHNLLTKHCKFKNIEEFPIPFKCVATDVVSGTLHVFDKGDAALAMRASSTIPAIFRPVKIGKELLVDGWCLCHVPVRQVKEMGADVVVAVDVLADCVIPIQKINNIVSFMFRVYDIVDAQSGSLAKEYDKEYYDLYIEPQLKGMKQYLLKDVEFAYQEGLEEGRKHVAKIKELLQD